MEFQCLEAVGTPTLQPGRHQTIPFQLTLPWQAPLTSVFGARVQGVEAGVRPEPVMTMGLEPCWWTVRRVSWELRVSKEES